MTIPLPKPEVTYYAGKHEFGYDDYGRAFSAKQLQAYGDARAAEARREAVPEGYAVVPIEPTQAMIEEGAQAIVQWENESKWPESWGSDAARHRKDARRAYMAMIEVAQREWA